MQVKVYFCPVLYNEDSELIQATDVKRESIAHGTPVDGVSSIQDSKTTLSTLYKDGWRLIQVVPSHETNGYRLFLEKE